jgi:hypothetical protein
MAEQTKKGKAFEYACLKALEDSLKDLQEIAIDETSAYKTAREFYQSSDVKTVNMMDNAAKAAVRIILRLEPQLKNPDNNIPLHLSIQEDAQGIAGDVRDVLCIRKQNQWEIGLSCKHNHSAVKHSRLSNTIDFGEQWFGRSCSEEYFNEIEPLFTELKELKDKKIEWKQILGKDDRFYVPLLNAFVSELKRLDEKYPEEIPQALLMYLLGRNDFYKVITKDTKKITQIQAYNIFGTLNRQSEKVKAELKVHQLKLPTKFYDISYKKNSKNTIIVTCDNGWALSFRIHSARTLVEPSLKFDINLIGVPESLHTQIEPW